MSRLILEGPSDGSAGRHKVCADEIGGSRRTGEENRLPNKKILPPTLRDEVGIHIYRSSPGDAELHACDCRVPTVDKAFPVVLLCVYLNMHSRKTYNEVLVLWRWQHRWRKSCGCGVELQSEQPNKGSTLSMPLAHCGVAVQNGGLDREARRSFIVLCLAFTPHDARGPLGGTGRGGRKTSLLAPPVSVNVAWRPRRVRVARAFSRIAICGMKAIEGPVFSWPKSACSGGSLETHRSKPLLGGPILDATQKTSNAYYIPSTHARPESLSESFYFEI